MNAAFQWPVISVIVLLPFRKAPKIAIMIPSSRNCIHFAMSSTFDQTDPAAMYQRFIVVYALPVAGTNPQRVFSARMVGFMGSELNSLGNELSEYYSKSSQ